MRKLIVVVGWVLVISGVLMHMAKADELPCKGKERYALADGTPTCDIRKAMKWGYELKAQTKATEKQYQEAHHTGQMEYRLQDGSRVDDLTKTHAIEYDFAKKWAEAVGQSLHYARMTGKRAGIVLIVLKESDMKKVHRIMDLKLPITLWVVRDLTTEPEMYSW